MSNWTYSLICPYCEAIVADTGPYREIRAAARERYEKHVKDAHPGKPAYPHRASTTQADAA